MHLHPLIYGLTCAVLACETGNSAPLPKDHTVSKSQAIQRTTDQASDKEAIRPFHVHFSDEALADLRRRILATRWPEKETVADLSQGVPLAMMKDLAQYWATDYDWRKAEAKLTA